MCKARFEGDDAEQKAIECEQNHPKSAEVAGLEFSAFDDRLASSGLPQYIAVKFDNGKIAKYRYTGE